MTVTKSFSFAEGSHMLDLYLGGIAAAAFLVYLVYALMKPEAF